MCLLIDSSIAKSSSTFNNYFENCMTFVLCSSQLDEGECYVQYGPSSQNLGPPIQGPLNSSFPLPLTEATTTYYYQVTINSSLITHQLAGNFTTGECELVYSFLRT